GSAQKKLSIDRSAWCRGAFKVQIRRILVLAGLVDKDPLPRFDRWVFLDLADDIAQFAKGGYQGLFILGRETKRSGRRSEASVARSLAADNENVETAIGFRQSSVAGHTLECDHAMRSETRRIEWCASSAAEDLAHSIRACWRVAETQKR